VDPWRAPARIVRLHATDQLPDFLTDLRAAEPPGTQSPKQPEPGAVSGDHGIRLHDNQSTGPACPQAAECYPEETVRAAQPRPGLLSFEDRELLAKSGGFQSEAMSRDKEGPQVSDCHENESDHHSDGTQYRMLLRVRNLFIPFTTEF
jgi:hypothetical protein